MGALQDEVTEDFQQRLVTQSERIDKLSKSVIESQKNIKDTTKTMQPILVGMENLGENFKQLQESLDCWQLPENPEAEAEHQRLNAELLKEVSLSVPAISGSMEVDVNPVVSYPQVTAQLFSVPQAVNPSQSEVRITEELQQMGMHSEWVTGMELQKPYPGAPNLPVIAGFSMSNKGQEAQARIPQFFNFIGSRTNDAQVARRMLVNVTAPLSRIPNSVPEKYPETQCDIGYYICPL